MKPFFKLLFGSHLYGTSTPESDKDWKQLYVPSAREIVLGRFPKTVQSGRKKASCERNTKDDVDVETFSLCRFLELLMEGQTVALDILFGYRVTGQVNGAEGFEIMDEVYDNRSRLLTRNVNAFVGYARQQAAKYGIKGSRLDALKRTMEILDQLPERDKLFDHVVPMTALVVATKELVSLEKSPLVEIVMLKGPDKVTPMPHLQVCGRKVPFGSTVKFAKQVFGKILEGYGQRAKKAHLEGGIDWKALSHAVRVNEEALELLNTHHITFPRPEAELLKQIKLGQLPYEQVATMIEEGLLRLTQAHEKSTLREEPDQEWADDLIFKVYSRKVTQT